MIAPSLLTPFDLHLFNEGTHSHLYEKLGAHLSEDPKGASFAVWAPNADWVSVIGDFNGWDRDDNKLVPREQSGIWEGFIGGVEHGALYKYHVHSRVTRTGADKADPFAVYAEQPPRQAPTAGRRPGRSTRFTSARGCACPRRATAGSHTASWRHAWLTTPTDWASPTSSSCP